MEYEMIERGETGEEERADRENRGRETGRTGLIGVAGRAEGRREERIEVGAGLRICGGRGGMRGGERKEIGAEGRAEVMRGGERERTEVMGAEDRAEERREVVEEVRGWVVKMREVRGGRRARERRKGGACGLSREGRMEVRTGSRTREL